MYFALTEEQVQFRDAVANILATTSTATDIRNAWADQVLAGGGLGNGNGRIPAAWNALHDMGLLGICVPEELDGLGFTDEELQPILVECGYHGLPDPILSTAGIAAPLLSAIITERHPGAEQAQVWLNKIMQEGVSIGMTFAGSRHVSSAASLDGVLYFDSGNVSLLSPDMYDITPVTAVDGARHLGAIVWDGDASVLSVDGADADGLGFALTRQAFDRAVAGSAALLVGLSRQMLELTVDYAKERQQFGVPIGSFQAVKHQLADASLALEFAAPLVSRAAYSLRTNDADTSIHASMAKAKASDAAKQVGAVALQVHGGIGYTVECDLHLYLKRSWALVARYGDAEFHRRRIRTQITQPV